MSESTFMKKAQAAAKPKLACLGKITSVGEVQQPKDGGFYHHIPIEITPIQSGLKATLRLLFWPEVFTTDPESFKFDGTMKKGTNKQNDENRSRAFVYRAHIASTSDNAFLQVLVATKFAEFEKLVKAQIKDGKIEPAEFRKIIAALVTNQDIAYVLGQSTDKKDDGTSSLGDRYEIRELLPYTKESVKNLMDRAAKSANQKDISKVTKVTFNLAK